MRNYTDVLGERRDKCVVAEGKEELSGVGPT